MNQSIFLVERMEESLDEATRNQAYQRGQDQANIAAAEARKQAEEKAKYIRELEGRSESAKAKWCHLKIQVAVLQKTCAEAESEYKRFREEFEEEKFGKIEQESQGKNQSGGRGYNGGGRGRGGGSGGRSGGGGGRGGGGRGGGRGRGRGHGDLRNKLKVIILLFNHTLM